MPVVTFIKLGNLYNPAAETHMFVTGAKRSGDAPLTIEEFRELKREVQNQGYTENAILAEMQSECAYDMFQWTLYRSTERRWGNLDARPMRAGQIAFFSYGMSCLPRSEIPYS